MEHFQTTPSPANKLAYDKAKLELDLFLTESVEKILRKTKHTLYMKANKPTTFLALTLRRTDHLRKPIQLQITKNTYSSNPLKIVNEFRRKLYNIYRDTYKFDQTHLTFLLSNIQLPSLSIEQHETLEKSITNFEAQSAIKTLKLHKRPGPDGFSATYYKRFSTLLSPLLTEAFNSLLLGHSFRPEILLASIYMIPKVNSEEEHGPVIDLYLYLTWILNY